MMTEQRFTNVGGVEEYVHLIFDNKTAKTLSVNQTVKKLNEQQDTIITLRRRLEKINGGYGHLTHRNGLTANEWVIKAQEKELKNKDEMISEFIERHSEDIVKISELQATIGQLQDLCGESDSENAKLRIENKRLQEEIRLLKPTNIEQYEQIVQLQEEIDNNKLADSLADEIKKNGVLNEELNQLRIENMRLKKKRW